MSFVKDDLGSQLLGIPDGEISHLYIALTPFSRAQFLGVFERYNAAFWPVAVAAFLLGIVIVGLLIRNHPKFTSVAAWGLAFMWAWTGIAYYWIYFGELSRAGKLFAPFFLLEALLLCFVAVNGAKLPQATRRDFPTFLGAGLIGYALFAYPLIGIVVGDDFARLPMFGLTPCPLTLYTFGIFLMADRVFPRALWIIPLLWTIVGGAASFLLRMPQDWLLLVSGLLAVVAVWNRLPDEQSVQ